MKTVGIWMDLERGNYPIGAPIRVPASGELVATVCKNGSIGSVYNIVDVREVKRRDPSKPPRFALRCRHMRRGFLISDIVWYLAWYPRRRKSPP